jgi:deoxyribonuclease-4
LGLITELQRAPLYGATLVNTHIGSHRGEGHRVGLQRLAATVAACLAEAPASVRLVLENSAGGGDNIGSTIEQLEEILSAVAAQGGAVERLAFCLDTAHLWGAGYDLSTVEGAVGVVDRFGQLIGLDRLALVHLNDSKTPLGSRNDRHEHVGAGQIGPVGLGALLRVVRLRETTFLLETPGVDVGYDAVNLRRSLLLYGGAETLPVLPPKAFKLTRRSTRSGPPRATRSGG